MMPSLKHRLIECRYIFSTSLLFVIIALLFSALYSKPDLFLTLTPWHHVAGDYFFFGITQLGNGIFVVAVTLFLMLRKQYAAAMIVLLSYAFSGLLAQAIKHFIVEQRPYLYFTSIGKSVYIVKGETVLGHSSSFPSGHTASIFSLVTALAMAFQKWNKQWGWLLLIALLVGYSRMYLSNHYFIDVGVGALFGILATPLAYWVVYKFQQRKGKVIGY